MVFDLSEVSFKNVLIFQQTCQKVCKNIFKNLIYSHDNITKEKKSTLIGFRFGFDFLFLLQDIEINWIMKTLVFTSNAFCLFYNVFYYLFLII